MTLKIMWLHSHITNASGSSKFLYNVLKNLSKFFEITLFVQKPITFFNVEFKKLPIDIITLSNSSTSDLNFWLNFSSEVKKQKLFLKDQSKNYDLVISSFFPMNIIAQNLGLKHLQFCFQPYAFFWDDDLIKSLPFSKKILLKFYKKLFKNLDLIATKSSDTLLTINEGSRNSIEIIYGKKSIPTYMGIDIPKNESKKNLEKYKKIIHTTDWSPLKNTLWLIEQFSILQNNFSNVTLMITETNIDYSEKNKALKLIKEKNLKNIIFLGTLSSDDYSKCLESSDVVIYSGFGHGITTSLFVLECMALGIPPLVTKQCSEDVINENTGYVYNNDDEFQYYLIKLLENDELRCKLGQTAQKYVLKKHSWTNVGKIFQNEILELMK